MTLPFKYAGQIGWPVVILLLFFLLDPFELGYLAGYFLVPIIYTRRAFLVQNLDFDFFILFLFSVVYAMFYFFKEDIQIQMFLFYLLFPPVFYLLGKYVVSKTSHWYHLYFIFITVGCLYSFTGFVSVSKNLLQGGFAQFDRTLPSFWTGKPITATLMAAYFTFNMCIPALILVGKNRFNALYKLVGLGIFVVSLLCVFRLGSRTQVAICAISTIAALFYIVPRQRAKQNLVLLMVIAVIGGLIYLYVPLDLNADYLSVLGERITDPNASSAGSAGNRTQRWAKSLENLFQKPFGWGRNEFGYSHNLWLDVAQENGVLPFFLLLIFSIKGLWKTKNIALKKGGNLAMKSLILIYILALYLLFFVEPIMQGAFFLFVVYCFFQGAANRYWSHMESSNNESTAAETNQKKIGALEKSHIGF